MLALFRNQPRAFYMIFMVEVWERFGYYTVQGILTLYFIRALGFSAHEAYFAFGAFSALMYGMACIGGILGDSVLGTKRTLVVGLITLAAGYFMMALGPPSYTFFSLGLICMGGGIFKANPSNLLSKCYKENDPRLHSGFTLFYMSINLSSTFALFLGPILSNRYGYSSAYFLSFVGLMLGLLNYYVQRRSVEDINTAADLKKIPYWGWGLMLIAILIGAVVSAYLLKHINTTQNLVILMTILVLGLYFYYMYREGKDDRKVRMKMWVALILMIEAIIFFVLYQQMPTSLTLFAVHNVSPNLLGIPIDPQSFQALNPIWIIAMSPVLAIGYNKINQRGLSFTIPYKFALGMFCCGLSFALLYFARFAHNELGIVSSGWLIGSYFFQSIGELLISALGVAMVAELVPSNIAGFVMGMWLLTTGIAGFLGATVASWTAFPSNIEAGIPSLMIYTRVFGYIGIVTLLIAGVMWVTSARLSLYIGDQDLMNGRKKTKLATKVRPGSRFLRLRRAANAKA